MVARLLRVSTMGCSEADDDELSPAVCSGRGECGPNNSCICEIRYSGDNCLDFNKSYHAGEFDWRDAFASNWLRSKLIDNSMFALQWSLINNVSSRLFQECQQSSTSSRSFRSFSCWSAASPNTSGSRTLPSSKPVESPHRSFSIASCSWRRSSEPRTSPNPNWLSLGPIISCQRTIRCSWRVRH